MNRQMTAERTRRAMVTQASGERESAVMVAEGQKQAEILKAEGEKQAEILKAQGEREAQLLRAQGFALALRAIYEQAQRIDANTMALQYMEALKALGASESTKFVLPLELTTLAQQVLTAMTQNAGAAPEETPSVSGSRQVVAQQ
jgi:regulator of protease activity HflC (stomatin/prohibitin superfamily)